MNYQSAHDFNVNVLCVNYEKLHVPILTKNKVLNTSHMNMKLLAVIKYIYVILKLYLEIRCKLLRILHKKM